MLKAFFYYFFFLKFLILSVIFSQLAPTSRLFLSIINEYKVYALIVSE